MPAQKRKVEATGSAASPARKKATGAGSIHSFFAKRTDASTTTPADVTAENVSTSSLTETAVVAVSVSETVRASASIITSSTMTTIAASASAAVATELTSVAFFNPSSAGSLGPLSTPIAWHRVNEDFIWGEFDPTGGDGSAARKVSLGNEKSPPLAAFDIDSTLITTRSGNVFAKDAADWKFLDPSGKSVSRALRRCAEAGCRIAFFTNQSGFAAKKGAKGEEKEEDFKGKVTQVARSLKVPLLLFVSSGDDEYRKPRPGMFEFMEREFGPVNLEESFFVGDAAGRAAGWKAGRKKDFSDSDRKFAGNVGIRFYTPEEFFADEAAAPFEMKGFDPSTYVPPANVYTPVHLPLVAPDKARPEIVLFVGSPGCGKSSFAKMWFEPAGYTIVNQDTLKSVSACMTHARNALLSSRSVVIDATNRNVTTRAQWFDFANKGPLAGKVKQVRCVHFTAPKDMCRHNGALRAVLGERKQLADLVYNSFWSQLEEPTKEEGFEAVLKVGFTPEWILDQGKSLDAADLERQNKLKKLWMMRLT
ncbi:PNK3P-domain-containing protein [Gonapodya prolifera JEL478]|uniref:PNK3P-domain-containing protein n=1 Tax=Gonapodya prolifera (strain JEL478) TaxID=1344416 RepID=A0A139ALT7_GONPJ|nr:PNK3P-domain-containing protein [Gonapodya prolifera JEL478]|eukprot:KXS17415.1 PNK3P-domain-containing protein [Gonapodya prolifera JEL478]